MRCVVVVAHYVSCELICTYFALLGHPLFVVSVFDWKAGAKEWTFVTLDRAVCDQFSLLDDAFLLQVSFVWFVASKPNGARLEWAVRICHHQKCPLVKWLFVRPVALFTCVLVDLYWPILLGNGICLETRITFWIVIVIPHYCSISAWLARYSWRLNINDALRDIELCHSGFSEASLHDLRNSTIGISVLIEILVEILGCKLMVWIVSWWHCHQMILEHSAT